MAELRCEACGTPVPVSEADVTLAANAPVQTFLLCDDCAVTDFWQHMQAMGRGEAGRG